MKYCIFITFVAMSFLFNAIMTPRPLRIVGETPNDIMAIGYDGVGTYRRVHRRVILKFIWGSDHCRLVLETAEEISELVLEFWNGPSRVASTSAVKYRKTISVDDISYYKIVGEQIC
jgi:hypothetical protein